MASRRDQILAFLEKNENGCDLILGVLYGCKNGGRQRTGAVCCEAVM